VLEILDRSRTHPEFIMRSFLLFATITAVATIAACSDNPQTTAPARARTMSSDVAAARTVSPAAKPKEQVGFTKVDFIESPEQTAGPNGNYGTIVWCPAGTTVVGGGFRFTSAITATPPVVASSSRFTNATGTGWAVGVVNSLAGAQTVKYIASVLCAS
jgi:hypothetical protein